MENQAWQVIPGTADAEIYPLIRKVDATSSNSYLVRTDEQVIIIDPGASSEQMSHLIQVVTTTLEEKRRSTFIYLTHCHVDHFLQAANNQEIRRVTGAKVLIHKEGTRALETGDVEITQAKLLGQDLLPVRIDFSLFSTDDQANEREEKPSLVPGTEITVATHRIELPNGDVLQQQIVPIGKGDILELYHTPGHSPDSICIRIGSLLFVGDLLCAVAPGIAGIVGWNQQDLVNSVKKVLWLLDASDIHHCCPGHGQIIPTATAKSSLHRMLEELLGLAAIEEMNLGKIKEACRYAEELLEEAREAFSILAGRLYYLSYFLEELEESAEAEKYRDLLDSDRIDEFLTDFDRYLQDFRAGKKIEVQLVLKAVQIVQRIGKLFDRSKLEQIIDTLLLRRTERLLIDFVNTVRGLRFKDYRLPVDVNDLIHSLLQRIKTPSYPEERILDVVDHKDEYLRELASRIAYLPLFRDVNVEFKAGVGPALVNLDQERFTDALTSLLEDLIGTGVRDIQISSFPTEGRTLVKISFKLPGSEDILGLTKWRFYRRRFGICGGILNRTSTPEGVIFLIELSSCL